MPFLRFGFVTFFLSDFHTLQRIQHIIRTLKSACSLPAIRLTSNIEPDLQEQQPGLCVLRGHNLGTAVSAAAPGGRVSDQVHVPGLRPGGPRQETNTGHLHTGGQGGEHPGQGPDRGEGLLLSHQRSRHG